MSDKTPLKMNEIELVSNGYSYDSEQMNNFLKLYNKQLFDSKSK